MSLLHKRRDRIRKQVRASRSRYLIVVPLCLWLVVIAFLSSQTYQEQSIQPLLQNHISTSELQSLLPAITLRYDTSSIDAQRIPYRFVEFVFRKTAHLFVYAVLALCAYFAFLRVAIRPFFKSMLAIGIVIAVGGLDEWNQSYSIFRTGKMWDFALDIIGGIAGVLMAAGSYGIWRRWVMRTPRRQLNDG